VRTETQNHAHRCDELKEQKQKRTLALGKADEGKKKKAVGDNPNGRSKNQKT